MHTRLTISIALLCAAIEPALADNGAVTTDSPSAAPAAVTQSASNRRSVDRISAALGTSVSQAINQSADLNTRGAARVQHGSLHDDTSLSGPPPANLDSATLFQVRNPVPLGGRAVEDAAQRWAQTGDAPVLVGTNGTVMYAYDQSHPIVTCAPLRLCLINLMAHEHITNLSIGDSVRWLIESADAGAGNEVTPVVIIKPTDANLVTNLAITTDAGRVYYLTLHSDQRKYVPQVGFYDPQAIVIRLQQQPAAAEAKATAHEESVVDTLGSVDPATLDFGFTCKAETHAAEPWLPLRVFAGGGHTYLQMPETLPYGDAPALFNLVDIGHHTQTELINSRLLHGYYVIDGLPVRFKLLVGAGKGARSVACTHG